MSMRSSGTSTPGSRHPTPIYTLKHSELLKHESSHSAIQSGKQRGSVLKHPRESNNNWSQHVSAIGATLSDASNPCFTKTLSHNGEHTTSIFRRGTRTMTMRTMTNATSTTVDVTNTRFFVITKQLHLVLRTNILTVLATSLMLCSTRLHVSH